MAGFKPKIYEYDERVFFTISFNSIALGYGWIKFIRQIILFSSIV